MRACHYTPHFNEVERGVYWYHLVRLSVCPSVHPSVRPSVRPSVDKIVSALYLQQYSSDPFHICTSYQATKEGVSHVMPVSKFKNLIQYDSMVWVIMRRWGVSSERRRSSYSSFNLMRPNDAGLALAQVMACCQIVLSKSLPEKMLINHQWGLVAFTWCWFRRKYSRFLSLIWVWKWLTL